MVSLIIYMCAFWLIKKVKWHVLIEIIFLAGILGSIYFNVANKGNIITILPIQITDEVRLVSFLIGIIYLVTAFKITGKNK